MDMYDNMGIRHYSDEERKRNLAQAAARLNNQDEARRRSDAAWLRLCGSVSPIGRLQGS